MGGTMPNVAFPAHLEADLVLRDGSTVRIRPTRRGDETRIENYLIGLSPETRRLRFLSPAIDVRDIARRAVDVDHANRLPKMDVAALEEMLLRVSALAEGHPEIVDMDCNPVMALPEGAVVVDARVRVEQPPPKPLGSRGG